MSLYGGDARCDMLDAEKIKKRTIIYAHYDTGGLLFVIKLIRNYGDITIVVYIIYILLTILNNSNLVYIIRDNFVKKK